jgi:hypothetical protein
MGECPLIKYISSPVRDSFPTVCSRCAVIPFPLFLPSGPIPGQRIVYPCVGITGDHVITRE